MEQDVVRRILNGADHLVDEDEVWKHIANALLSNRSKVSDLYPIVRELLLKMENASSIVRDNVTKVLVCCMPYLMLNSPLKEAAEVLEVGQGLCGNEAIKIAFEWLLLSVYRRLGNMEKAKELFDKRRSQDAFTVVEYGELGMFLLFWGDLNNAIICFSSALEKSISNFEKCLSLSNLAMCFDATGHTHLAKAYYDVCIPMLEHLHSVSVITRRLMQSEILGN